MHPLYYVHIRDSFPNARAKAEEREKAGERENESERTRG